MPWYDFPETETTLDKVWQETRRLLQKEGIYDIPGHLDHHTPAEVLWQDPQLTLGQCCGLDLFDSRTDVVIPIAAPIMATLDVSPGHYFSHIVVQTPDCLEGQLVCAVNSVFSYSGCTALLRWLDNNGYQDFKFVLTGSHSASAAALRSQRADIAAIDAFSWQFLAQDKLTIIGASQQATAPPFVVGKESPIAGELITQSLHAAFARHGKSMGITGVIPVTREQYSSLQTRHTALRHMLVK